MEKDLALFVDITKKLLEAEVSDPVVSPIPVEEVLQTMDLTLPDEATSDAAFAETLEQLVLTTPRTSTKLFFNQLFGGRHSRATLGELLAVMLNNSMYTYKVGGPQIIMEKLILRKFADLVGYGAEADGTLAPGGSMTNLMGLIMARDYKDERSRFDGVSKKMTVYTSDTCHYSLYKNAAFAGIGRNNMRKIKNDAHGRMSVPHLKAAIEQDLKEGYLPTMINATAGTTVIGAFDPIREIAAVAKEHDIWLHVDGAYCGSVLFTDKYKHLVDGSELADSFTLNAHKMLGTPLSCSLITVKHKRYLYDSFSQGADYLYQTADDDYNPGKTSLQCGRRNDALKFWSIWKTVGTNGIGEIVDHQFDLARHAKEYVKSNSDYTLYNDDDTIAICFNYKGIDPKLLCNKLYEEGEIMVGYGQFDGQEFVRLVTVNFSNSKADLDAFFSKMEAFAATHFAEVTA